MNLRVLVDQQGREQFLGQMHWTNTRLKQFIGENPTRNVGDSVADSIEQTFGLARWWLDTPRSCLTERLQELCAGCEPGDIEALRALLERMLT